MQVNNAGVEVELGREVNAAMVMEEKPDGIIIAVGAKPYIPDIPGIERDNVPVADDVLSGKASTCDSVMIIWGEPVGCETAEYLVGIGKKVVAITTLQTAMATKEGISLREAMLARLERFGIEMIAGVIRYDEINNNGVKITTAEGKTRLLEADSVVLAAGYISNTELASELRDKGIEFQPAGDCIEPGRIMDVIAEGYRVGSSILDL